MKVYKLEVMVIDFDELGGDDIASIIEHTRYPNHCISPTVMLAMVDLGFAATTKDNPQKTCGKCGAKIPEPGPCPSCQDRPYG